MLALTIIGCIAVFAASLFLFRRELDDSMNTTVEVAATVAYNEISEMKVKAQVAAFGIQSNRDMIEALMNDDRERIIHLANSLKNMTQVDFCNILYPDGTVITRTHAPETYGDNISNQPHVALAKQGYSTTVITQGAVIKLGVYAGAPIYDYEMNMIGVVSMGFRLDIQEFSFRLADVTGCEVSVFLSDERISTTLLNPDGTYALGAKAPTDVSQRVLAGEAFQGVVLLSGNTVLTKYVPLFSINNNVIGMLFVGYDTTADESKMQVFIATGLLLTFIVLMLCAALAVPISGVVKDQLDNLIKKTIVQQKELEQMLAHNQSQLTKLNLMVKAANIGLWDFEVQNDDPFNPLNPHTYTDNYRNLLGYTNEKDFPNVMGSWRSIVHPDDAERVTDSFRNHLFDLSGGTPYREEYRMLKKDGEYAHYIAFCETLRDDNGYPLRASGAMMDITDEKEANERLRNARDLAEAANRSKSIFLANMSHEIRTPMNSIIGFSELAQDDEVSEKTRQYLSNISENALWLLDIINDILDNSKIESGKISLENISFDIHELITQCQEAFIPKTIDKDFTFFCYAEQIRGKRVIGDPIRLRQILTNLLSNAAKFTSTGTIKLYTSVRETDNKRMTVKFEVQDSGIGMSPENVENIFKPYVQADDSVTRKFGGTGLGLPISKSIVELMGGELEVQSIQGVGSTFSFELEFELATEKSGDKALLLGTTEKPCFDADILICEDNLLNQQVICDHLTRVGIRTTVACDGQQGVEIVETRMKSLAEASAAGEEKPKIPFDLVFMDIHMPVMDGLEAASRISEICPKMPIIALTANIMANDVELYKSRGMLDLLSKPFTSQDLWKCLLKHLPVVDYITQSNQSLAEEEDMALRQLQVYFAQSNKTIIENLKNALDNNDYKLAHRMVHTLKSNAGQIGETALQKIAAETELMLSDGENKLPKKQLAVLEKELNPVLEKLSAMITEQSEDINHVDNKEALKIIEKLEPLLKQHSTECMNMLDEIRSIPNSQKLLQCVDEFEFKQAMAELLLIKERLNKKND